MHNFHLTSKSHALRLFSLIFQAPPQIDIETVVKQRLNVILPFRERYIATGPLFALLGSIKP